jgi:hypothetical protein
MRSRTEIEQTLRDELHEAFTNDQIGAILLHFPTPPDEDHLRRNARRWGARGPDLLLRYKCSRSTTISDQWPDQVRLSDLEAPFACKACRKKAADVRPNVSCNKNPVSAMDYR